MTTANRFQYFLSYSLWDTINDLKNLTASSDVTVVLQLTVPLARAGLLSLRTTPPNQQSSGPTLKDITYGTNPGRNAHGFSAIVGCDPLLPAKSLSLCFRLR